MSQPLSILSIMFNLTELLTILMPVRRSDVAEHPF